LRSRIGEPFVRLKTPSFEERKERRAQQCVAAEQAMKQHEENQRALFANRDWLSALRLARQVQEKNK
jgi:hypothetical protein